MSTRVTQVEKELMWKLYQKYGTFKAVAQRMGRSAGTVFRYVREYEAAVGAAGYILNSTGERNGNHEKENH